MVKRRDKERARHAVPLQQDSLKPPDLPIWECPNCGQHYFGAQPPDMCDYCQDFTTWRRLNPEETEPDSNP